MRFRQWFNNQEGIKGFAEQAIAWLLLSTLKLAEKLKKRNEQLAEKIKELKVQLDTRETFPTIDADEFPAFKGKIRTYSIILWICIIGEAFFNFFAAKALFNFDGWLAITAQTLFAILITWVAVVLFENFFFHLLYQNPYKGEHKEPRHWGTLISLLIMAVGFEAFTYYICKVRSIQIEGGEGSGIVGKTMIIAGMLIPIIAGYYAYEKRRFISPYKNTICIANLKKQMAMKANEIKTNLQRMENHFKKKCEGYWALLQEFKVYKENWNQKHSIPRENLEGHFSACQDSFFTEAINRYRKEALQDKALVPDYIIPALQQHPNDPKVNNLFDFRTVRIQQQ